MSEAEQTTHGPSIIWEVQRGSLLIGADYKSDGNVFIELGGVRLVMHPEEARKLFARALVNIPSGDEPRADTAVAEAALSLCYTHEDRAQGAERQLRKTERELADALRALGHAQGRLEAFEVKS